MLITPLLTSNTVTETDYGTFMSMIEQQNIGTVQVEDTQILFTDKDNTTIYSTGVMDDPTLTERLYECGAKFDRVTQEQMSPLMS